jgi:adenylate cyclase
VETSGVEHRLAAILCADVVGYSRLMADDEAATVQALAGYREEVGRIAARHHGRIVDFTGDNFLAEFPAAVEAVRCALAIQRAAAERNEGLSEARRMRLRVGVHLGDVRVEGARIYGEGVNIAARLEALAPAGGVCISATIHEQVRNKLDCEFEDIGTQTLKNIPHPVRAYRIGPIGEPAAQRGSADAAGIPTEQPVVAVLPFDNLSPDPEQEYFADAIVEDLIVRLSAWRGFPVIARNSTFTYKGKAVDVKQVSRDLGVRYVVEGSVRKAGDRVRISAQLIDAATGHHLWAQKYDRPLREVFEVQDEVSECIVGALHPALRLAEAERARRARPENLDAWAIVNRAWTELQSDLSNRDTIAAAVRAVEGALELDPGYALGHSVLALAQSLTHWPGRPEAADGSPDPLVAARRALALDPDDSRVQQISGAIMGNLGRTADAVRAYERSLELDPNNAQAWGGLGAALLYLGRAEEGLRHLERAMQLSPRDPLVYHWVGQRALGCLILGRYAEAEAQARASLERRRTRMPWLVLTAALACLDRRDEARRAFQDGESLRAGLDLDHWELFARQIARTPEQAAQLVEAMRAAAE